MAVQSLAGSFRYPGVAEAYAFRPPYPPSAFEVLDGLLVDGPRTVLDIGAGDGALARPLAERVDRVDAVDISRAMVDAGRQRPGGRRDNLSWHVQPVEELNLTGPYALVTAGASLHWMNWTIVLRGIDRVLAPGGYLAIVDQRYHDLPWRTPVAEVIARHSRDPDYDPGFSLPDELSRRNLFRGVGAHETPPIEFVQSAMDYIEQFHSTASLARELMSPAEADRFDAEVAAVVREYQDGDGMLTLWTVATIFWGRPLPAAR